MECAHRYNIDSQAAKSFVAEKSFIILYKQ